MYVEDFIGKESVSEESKTALISVIGCSWPLLGSDSYVSRLRDAGFVKVEIVDHTVTWKKFVRERAASYEADLERHIKVQGNEQLVRGLNHFYQTIAQLFQHDEVGGGIIYCEKPE